MSEVQIISLQHFFIKNVIIPMRRCFTFALFFNCLLYIAYIKHC